MVCLFEEPNQVFSGVFLLKVGSNVSGKKIVLLFAFFLEERGQGWKKNTVIQVKIIDGMYPCKLKIKREMSWLKLIVYNKHRK